MRSYKTFMGYLKKGSHKQLSLVAEKSWREKGLNIEIIFSLQIA